MENVFFENFSPIRLLESIGGKNYLQKAISIRLSLKSYKNNVIRCAFE